MAIAIAIAIAMYLKSNDAANDTNDNRGLVLPFVSHIISININIITFTFMQKSCCFKLF